MITIQPHEDHKRWQTDWNRDGDWTRTLKHGADGNCVYLQPTGCSIYGEQPWMCQQMDCRAYFLRVSNLSAQQRAMRFADRSIGPVLAEGKRRLATDRSQ